jgi:glycosyltransferase involved in cell wall biosynthesis
MRDATLPLVCICIPTFNAEKTIAATLRSVLEQTYKQLIIQVIDNNSSDATVTIVQSFSDERITLHRNPVNLGGEGNFNRCIALATGKYTAIYHADDMYRPEMVAAQVAFLEQYPQARAVFTEALLIDEFDKPIGSIRQPKNLAASGPLHYFPELFKAILEHSNFLICPSLMALTSVYQDDIKSWRGELFGSSADLDVWLRMLQLGPVGILAETNMSYRISRVQGSANVRLTTERAAFFWVLDHYLAQPGFRSLLAAADLVNYQRLERRDRIMRAVNALLHDQPADAAALCSDIFTKSALKAAWQTRRGRSVLVLGLYLRTMLALRWHRLARASLMHMKRMANK